MPKKEYSGDFFGDFFGDNPSWSAIVDEGMEDVTRDMLAILGVNFVGHVGSGKGTDCSINRAVSRTR